MNNLAVGITLAFSALSSGVGTSGFAAELGGKLLIDRSDHPILRSIATTFAKTIQTAAAAFSLVLIGSLSTNPIVFGGVLVAGAVLVLTPTVNELMKMTDESVLKSAIRKLDLAANITAKLVNGALLAVGAFMALGPIGGSLAGAGSFAATGFGVLVAHREYAIAQRRVNWVGV